MCASYESKFSIRQLVDAFAHAGVEIGMGGTGLPNLEPRDEVRPTDTDRALRALPGAEAAELIPMRFGFPPPRPKAGPVINFRSEGRTFGNGPRGGRCLVPVSGFYEFTGDKYPKTRWVLRGVDPLDARAELPGALSVTRAARRAPVLRAGDGAGALGQDLMGGAR